MPIKDILTAHGVDNAELNKALDDYFAGTVKSDVEANLADRLAEQGKESIPKTRFAEVNDLKNTLKKQVQTLENERNALQSKLDSLGPQVKELDTLRADVSARLRSDWKARQEIISDKADKAIKDRVDAFRAELKLPADGKDITDDAIRHNLSLLSQAEKFGGPFAASVAAPPKDGAAPAAPIGQVSTQEVFANLFKPKNQG